MNRVLLVTALLLLPALPAAAHEPSTSDFAVALATADTMTLDGELDEDAWDEAEDDRIRFSAPSTGRTDVLFVWHPEDRELWVGIRVKDGTDDGVNDHVDFAFAFDHADDTANDGDQVILRAHRDGTLESVSVEDEDDEDPGAPDDMDAEVDDAGTSGYTVEIRIDWGRRTHAGWAVWQVDDSDSDETEYPSGAHHERPKTWADVKGQKIPLEVTLRIDKTSAKIDDTLTLTAEIEDYDDLVDFDERIHFQRLDGTTWTTLGSKDPDDDGEAKTTTKVVSSGAIKYRARVAESDIYAEGLSAEITVNVADIYTKLYGDATLFVRYAADAAGWRTYTITMNASSGWPTIEASPDGVSWTRLSTGERATPLTTTWSAPDNAAWRVRGVPYDAAGKPGNAVGTELPAYTLPGTKTATTTTLDVRHAGVGANLSAAVSAGAGTVSFYRAPDTLLGTATIANGVATLEVPKALPGPQTYVARYGGSTTHAASTDRALTAWWPEDPARFSPRTTDPSGENVTLAVKGGKVAFAARSGDGPGIPGVVEIRVAAEGGNQTVLHSGLLPTGTLSLPWAPTAVGEHALEVRFWRASGTSVLLDTRTAEAEGADRAVEVTVQAPATAQANASIEFVVTLDPVPDGGEVRVFVGDVEVGNASADGTLSFAWKAVAGEHEVVARYSGTTGWAAAESDAETLVVTQPAPADEEPPAEDEDRESTPGFALLAALAALAVAARKKRA